MSEATGLEVAALIMISGAVLLVAFVLWIARRRL